MDYQSDGDAQILDALPIREEAYFVPGGRSVAARNVFSWVSGAWRLFKQQPWPWVGFAALSFPVSSAFSAIPLVGEALLMLLTVFLVAGIVYSCDLLRRKGAFAFGDIFAGFRHCGPLSIVFLIALMPLVLAFGASSFLDREPASSPAAGIIMSAAFLIYTMATWFAPALIIMHEIKPFDAVKMSLSACLKNFFPGILLFPVVIMLIIIGALLFGVGLLVTWPIILICSYTSYRDVFSTRKVEPHREIPAIHGGERGFFVTEQCRKFGVT